MKNVIIYAVDGKSEVENIIKACSDADVRVKDVIEIRDMDKYNPSAVILDLPEEKLREVAMVTKFKVPALSVLDKVPEPLIVRGDYYDFILKPINEFELKTRFKNMDKVKELKDTVNIVSTTDELTGLHNRKFLQERLDAEISRSKRYDTTLSCLLFDIDYFKVVNDMYGYEWGDVLLKKISEMLSAFVRKEDILTRYGDEEFMVILPNTTEENAFVFAERFRRDVEKMEFIPAGEEEKHPITISGGISSYPCMKNVNENANTLIRYAEHALYNAKKRGKNKVVLFSQVNLEM